MDFGLCSKGCNTHQIRARLESLPGELLIDLSNRIITLVEDLCDKLVVIQIDQVSSGRTTAVTTYIGSVGRTTALVHSSSVVRCWC